MDIIIYGAGYYGKKMLHCTRDYEKINVIGFIDSLKEGIYEGIPIMKISDDIDKSIPIVISVAEFEERYQIYIQLKEVGFQHIYYYLRKKYSSKKSFFESECVSLENIGENTLFYAEMSINDFCNLNCKGCNHYSPIFERKYPDLNTRIKDVEKISNLYDNVLEFGLIGGEPLLNPMIKDYIKKTRQLLPNTVIQMGTNGLLIPKLKEDVLCCISDNNIIFAISEYAPTSEIIKETERILVSHKIDYILKSAVFKEKFYKTLSLKRDSVYEKKCISKGCINICDGKIAKCPTVLYIEALNKKFQVSFPTEGVYTLEKFTNGIELNHCLGQRIPLCDYCINYQIPWEPCGRDKNLEDFVVIN